MTDEINFKIRYKPVDYICMYKLIFISAILYYINEELYYINYSYILYILYVTKIILIYYIIILYALYKPSCVTSMTIKN